MTLAPERARLPQAVPRPTPGPVPRSRPSSRSGAPDDDADLRVVVRHALTGLADPTRIPAAALDHRLEHLLRSALEAHLTHLTGEADTPPPDLADTVREACVCLHSGRFAAARRALHTAEDLLP